MNTIKAIAIAVALSACVDTGPDIGNEEEPIRACGPASTYEDVCPARRCDGGGRLLESRTCSVSDCCVFRVTWEGFELVCQSVTECGPWRWAPE